MNSFYLLSGIEVSGIAYFKNIGSNRLIIFYYIDHIRNCIIIIAEQFSYLQNCCWKGWNYVNGFENAVNHHSSFIVPFELFKKHLPFERSSLTVRLKLSPVSSPSINTLFR